MNFELIYRPTHAEVQTIAGKQPLREEDIQKLLRLALWEVWQGLPAHEFQKSPSAGGALGLRAQADGLYIWVPPDVCQLLETDPGTLLMAYGHRTDGSLRMTIQPTGGWALYSKEQFGTSESPEQATQRAKELNAKRIRESAAWGRLFPPTPPT